MNYIKRYKEKAWDFSLPCLFCTIWLFTKGKSRTVRNHPGYKQQYGGKRNNPTNRTKETERSPYSPAAVNRYCIRQSILVISETCTNSTHILFHKVLAQAGTNKFVFKKRPRSLRSLRFPRSPFHRIPRVTAPCSG